VRCICALLFRVLFLSVRRPSQACLLHIRDIVGRGPKTSTASATTVFPPGVFSTL
jgi:hypothetical protein